MLQPIANIVITVFPETLALLLDFSIPVNTKMMDEVFNNLVENKLGIQCSIGNFSCSVTHSRIWKSHEIALEIKRILELKDKVFTVYCQVEGDEVTRIQIK